MPPRSLSLAATLLLCGGLWGTRAFGWIRRALSPILALPHAAFALGFAFLLAPSGLIARALSPWATGWDRPPDLLIVNDPGGPRDDRGPRGEGNAFPAPDGAGRAATAECGSFHRRGAVLGLRPVRRLPESGLAGSLPAAQAAGDGRARLFVFGRGHCADPRARRLRLPSRSRPSGSAPTPIWPFASSRPQLRLRSFLWPGPPCSRGSEAKRCVLAWRGAPPSAAADALGMRPSGARRPPLPSCSPLARPPPSPASPSGRSRPGGPSRPYTGGVRARRAGRGRRSFCALGRDGAAGADRRGACTPPRHRLPGRRAAIHRPCKLVPAALPAAADPGHRTARGPAQCPARCRHPVTARQRCARASGVCAALCRPLPRRSLAQARSALRCRGDVAGIRTDGTAVPRPVPDPGEAPGDRTGAGLLREPRAIPVHPARWRRAGNHARDGSGRTCGQRRPAGGGGLRTGAGCAALHGLRRGGAHPGPSVPPIAGACSLDPRPPRTSPSLRVAGGQDGWRLSISSSRPAWSRP